MKAMMQAAAASPAAWVSVVCAALLVACTAEQDIRCGDGTELVGGRCVPAGDGGTNPPLDGSVGDAATCGEGTFLKDGTCQGKRPTGSACESGEQCLSDTCLDESRGATDGYCTQIGCTGRPCEAGAHCYYSRTEEQFLCLAYCDDDEDCRDGYACQPLYTSDVSVCAPSCAVTDACPSGTLCDEASGKCVLHECELGAPGQCGSDEDAGAASAGLICYADRLGISESGAVCLPACDPSASETPCADNEVCQPLPGDPANTGLCVPPLCKSTPDCSAGAVCMEGVCQPPARCDEEGACGGEGFVCVGGPGGQCMPACDPADGGDESCAGIHPGLTCSAALEACLPTGSYPGSVCRSDLNAPCDALTVRAGDETVSVPMACEDGVCLASCGEGGSALCESIDGSLTCAEDVFDAPLCLPKGSFPGGPCGAGETCAPLSRGGNTVPMVCEEEQCILTCDDGAGGDVLCAAIDASLVCIPDAFETTQDMCLPRGAYPGGPCGPGGACDAGMTCEDDRCLFQCGEGGELFCNGVSPGLSCAAGVYDEPVCLPRGSFPGSPCRPTSGDECDQNLSGLPDADMICSPTNVCVVQCEAPGVFASGDALCGVVSPALTCLSNPSSTDFCVTACGESNACPAGNSCLTSQDACLPTGSFLGSPCNAGACSGATPPLACGPTGFCGAACAEAGPSAYCQGLAGSFGQTWDTCADPDGGGPSGQICIDAP